MAKARTALFHLLKEDGEVERTIQIDAFPKEPKAGAWYKVDGIPCKVDRVAVEEEQIDIFVRPIKRQEIN